MFRWRLTRGQLIAIGLGIWVGALIGASKRYHVIMLWLFLTYYVSLIVMADRFGRGGPWRSVFSLLKRDQREQCPAPEISCGHTTHAVAGRRCRAEPGDHSAVEIEGHSRAVNREHRRSGVPRREREGLRSWRTPMPWRRRLYLVWRVRRRKHFRPRP